MDNIKKCCRICLKVKPNMRYLSSSELVDGKMCTISDILKSCTSIQVSLGDEYPNMICQHCINRLYYCWSFKGECEKSEATLQQNINKRKREQNTKASTSNTREPIQNNIASTSKSNENVQVMRFIVQNKQANENVPDENFVQKTTKLIAENLDKLLAEAVNNEQIKPVVKIRLLEEKPQTTASNAAVNKINVQQTENQTIDLTLNTTDPTDNEIEPAVLKDITSDDNKNDIKKQKLNEEAQICFICGDILKTKELYSSHIKTHADTDAYNCTICDKQFDVFSNLETHMKTHTGSNKCSHCMQYFPSTIALSDHVKTHNKKDFVCDLCCKDYYSRNNLNHHFKQIHSGVNQYFCGICMQGFTDKIQLQKHRNLHVNNKNSPTCATTSNSRQTLLFPCDVCNQVFTCHEALDLHCNQMHVTYKCEICLKKFTKHALKKHLLTHKNRRYFSCNFCEMVFGSMLDVKEHAKIHHTCIQCSQTFKNSHLLHLHMKTHAKTCE